MKAQGFDLKKNAYNNRFQPYLAYWGVFWTLLFILINGHSVFWHFNASEFLTACMYILVNDVSLSISDFSNISLLDLNIPIFVFLYLGYKIIMRTKIWKPSEMDFVTVSLDDSHITSSELTISFRASLLQKKPNYHWNHQSTSGSALQPSFSEQIFCRYHRAGGAGVNSL